MYISLYFIECLFYHRKGVKLQNIFLSFFFFFLNLSRWYCLTICLVFIVQTGYVLSAKSRKLSRPVRHFLRVKYIHESKIQYSLYFTTLYSFLHLPVSKATSFIVNSNCIQEVPLSHPVNSTKFKF